MPELRKDPISRRWVIIATERAARPTDFKHEAVEANDSDRCPFCEGREAQTPPEIFALRAPGTAPNTPGWTVRVVPNKFPALRIEGSTVRSKVGLFSRMDAIGAHEVIIETPNHDQHLGLQPVEHVTDVVRVYLQRYRDLRGDTRFAYGLLFRNHGRTAGASLSHPHSQLIALPVVPQRVAIELDAAEHYLGLHGTCIFCTMLADEQKAGARLVVENEAFVALEPYAARFPFETWILPKVHEANFGALRPELEGAFAWMLREVLHRLYVSLDNPPYNFIIHTLPYRSEAQPAYHWHVEVIPRLTQVAGFEWGTGFYINPVVPEEAARFLRETAPVAVAVGPGAGVRTHGEVGD